MKYVIKTNISKTKRKQKNLKRKKEKSTYTMKLRTNKKCWCNVYMQSQLIMGCASCMIFPLMDAFS